MTRKDSTPSVLTSLSPARGLGRDELRHAIDTAVDGIIVIDASGTVLLYNAACERLFGYGAGDVLGSNVSTLMPSPDRERHDTYIEDYLRTGTAKIIGIGRDVTGQRKDGSTFPLRLSVGELRGESGTPLFVGTIHDLTEVQLARERIEELQTELMRVSRSSALGAMGTVLAHELNQPLSAIASFLEAGTALIDEGEGQVSDRVRQYIDQAVAQTHRAGDVIRRLREFTRKGTHQRSTEDVNSIVEETCALAALGALTEGIDVTMNLAADLPPVRINSIQIQQIVLNLVRNSIEALAGQEVRAITVETAHRGDLIEVAVRDTGPGVAPVVRERLFEPFVSTKSDGIGIGLNICRTIVEAHGGTISADPGTAGGATFRFTLPVSDDTPG